MLSLLSVTYLCLLNQTRIGYEEHWNNLEYWCCHGFQRGMSMGKSYCIQATSLWELHNSSSNVIYVPLLSYFRCYRRKILVEHIFHRLLT